MGLYERAPLASHVQFVLGGDDVGRGTVHPVLIEEQPGNLMPAGQHRLGEAQGATGRGRMGRGEHRDSEFHG
ncbi:hypothetical protein D3C77_761490 [compost metagenome]